MSFVEQIDDQITIARSKEVEYGTLDQAFRRVAQQLLNRTIVPANHTLVKQDAPLESCIET